MAPVALWVYVQPYLLFVVTTVLGAGALFFALGALTRNVTFVYLQGVLSVVLYIAAAQLIQGNLNDFWPALLGFIAVRSAASARARRRLRWRKAASISVRWMASRCAWLPPSWPTTRTALRPSIALS